MFDISHLLVGTALAQTAADPVSPPGGSTTSVIMNFLPLLLIFAVFYVLIIRPQQKKLGEHDAMLKALRRGDRVVPGGGIVGVISKLDGDDYLVVEIADGVKVKVLRSTVSSLAAKTEPVVANDGEESGGAKKSKS